MLVPQTAAFSPFFDPAYRFLGNVNRLSTFLGVGDRAGYGDKERGVGMALVSCLRLAIILWLIDRYRNTSSTENNNIHCARDAEHK